MLAYFLALAVGLGSFSIYIAAFFFPEVHRKSDFAWSGVGLFYALILWACAGRITGALLLGQMAGVAMLGWLAWETLSLRRQVTPLAQQTPIPGSANLTGLAGGSLLPAFFGKKQDTAPKKPKFVRSKKPKTDGSEVTATPVPGASEVKVEKPSATSAVAEQISESSIESTPENAIALESTVSDFIAPAPKSIPVWSIEAPVTETSPAPAESAPSNETPLPLEVSEIVSTATVEPAEAQSEVKQQQELDEFGEIQAELTAPSQNSEVVVSPTAVSPTATKVSQKSAGFGGLFGNIKNSIGGFLGKGSDKSKSDPTPQTPTPKVTPTAELVAEIPAIRTPDIDQILESELAAAPVEVATETSSTAVEETQQVPLPPDVEVMTDSTTETSSTAVEETQQVPLPPDVEAMTDSTTETAGSSEIVETSIEPSETQSQASPETLEQPPDPVAELTEAVDIVETTIPTPPLEMTAVEVVSAVPADIDGSKNSIDSSAKQEVETISVDFVSIETTDDEPSQNKEKPELISPNPSDPDIVEAAKPAAESKSENISSEQPPTT
jgi:Ycf66 protein N-terminus